MNESMIVKEVIKFLRNNKQIVVTEMPFLQRRVDVVGYQPSNKSLVAVEAKIKNWRRAIRQAITCLLFADNVYIALPEEFIHRVNLDEIGRFGIGLIQVNSKTEILKDPLSSSYISEYHKQWVIDHLEHNSYR